MRFCDTADWIINLRYAMHYTGVPPNTWRAEKVHESVSVWPPRVQPSPGYFLSAVCFEAESGFGLPSMMPSPMSPSSSSKAGGG